MIKFVLIDDEPLAIDLLEDYINMTEGLELAGRFTNPIDALHALDKLQPDVVCLDVQMPELTGIQFMKITKGKYPVVLTTAYQEYALEGYEHDIVDYLLKPVSIDRFLIAVEKIKKRVSVNTESKMAKTVSVSDYIFIKSEYKTLKIDLADIRYLEGLSDYVAIHVDGKKHLTLDRLKAFESKLPSSSFVRVHKSYIINLAHIDHVERNRIVMGDQRIPVGATYQKAFVKRLG